MKWLPFSSVLGFLPHSFSLTQNASAPTPGPSWSHSCSLTRNGAGCGVTIDLLTPDQLLVQVDHLGEIVISLQDLSWNRKEGRGGFEGVVEPLDRGEEPPTLTPKAM